jgi:hypothetical protein
MKRKKRSRERKGRQEGKRKKRKETLYGRKSPKM